MIRSKRAAPPVPGRHSPGPWNLVKMRSGVLSVDGPGPARHVRTVVCDVFCEPEQAANARLIAAAPDLLAAAAGLLGGGRATFARWAALRAAVRRARGGA